MKDVNPAKAPNIGVLAKRDQLGELVPPEINAPMIMVNAAVALNVVVGSIDIRLEKPPASLAPNIGIAMAKIKKGGMAK